MKKLIIVIPAYNEEEILEKNMLKLYFFMKEKIKDYDWKIVISDNNSKDKTLNIAKKLSKKNKEIDFVHLEESPKSNSIKKAWLSKEADVYMYMDADLSTDIKHIPQLINGIEQGNDIVIGSRTSKESKTSRHFNRHIVSLILILILKILFAMKINDFQCGFKAINKKVRDSILPKMKALEVGFMDAEMLIVANKKGYKIKEIPVSWKDDRKSHAPVFKGIIDALKNIIRIKIDLIRGNYN